MANKIKAKEVGIIIFLLIVVTLLILFIVELVRYKEPVVKENIAEGCNGLDIFDTSLCLQRNVMSFYKYNVSNVGKELTFEELKEQGGVCSHYSNLYYQAGLELGFHSKEVDIEVDEDGSHIFTIISNSDGYCKLDERDTTCFEFKDGDSK